MSSKRTRAFYGMSVSGPSQTGGGNPPMIDGAFGGTGDFISDLSALKTQGARCIMKFTGAAANIQNADLSFSIANWKSTFDVAVARTSAQQMGNFVQDGTLMGHNVVDDAQAGSPVFGGNPPSLDQIDSIAAYSKSKWSQVPCLARLHTTYLAAKSDWTNLDYGWSQWHRRFGLPQTWLINNINDGRKVGLGCLFAYNLLDGGSGITAPWNQHPNLGAPSFGMSPQELDSVTAAFSSQTYALGVIGWSANPTFDGTNYYHYPSIQTALQKMANVAIGRLAGPINWREQSPSGSTDTSSGSTVTVTGSWGVISDGAGSIVRKNDPATITVPVPTGVQAGHLYGILCYSRDSSRTFARPSAFSEAQRISGNSAQGGELVLFYKLATTGEQDVTITMNGAGGAGNNVTARPFVFSNISQVVANVLATAGSAKSWAANTTMGPIKGLTSSKSDALVLICAGRANDFGTGSVDENNMSATTVKAGESWSRLFAYGSSLGNDAGVFLDWAATSGVPSVDTKSWSMTTGASPSNTSGAGCGFMVAFSPVAVVGGQPAAFSTVLSDVALSVGSNLSFTIVSTGSTPFTYSKDSGPSNITLGASTGAFQFTPTASGQYTIVLGVSNSFGSDSQSFIVAASSPGGGGSGGGGGGSSSTSTGVNHAPVVNAPGNKTITAHDLLAFNIVATDADGDQLFYRLDQGAPVGAFMEPNTGQFVWIPRGDQGPGTYGMVAVVTDGTTESRSTFTVTVNDTPWTRERGPVSQFGQVSATGNSFTRI